MRKNNPARTTALSSIPTSTVGQIFDRQKLHIVLLGAYNATPNAEEFISARNCSWNKQEAVSRLMRSNFWLPFDLQKLYLGIRVPERQSTTIR